MKSSCVRIFVCCLLLVILASYFALQAQLPARKEVDFTIRNSKILDVIGDRKDLIRVTHEPFVVTPPEARACAMFVDRRDVGNPHEGFAIHVYSTEVGRDMLATGKGIYPVNSFIIKEKLRSTKKLSPVPEKTAANAKPDTEKYTVELFTCMLKREPGYNPECGDWEFIIVDSAVNNVLARGKIDSCIACHQSYKTTDYVTRAYMPAAK